jgi:hypothetical protein
MPDERVQQRINDLLDEAEEALMARDWARLRDVAQDILGLDPTNEDAHEFLASAERVFIPAAPDLIADMASGPLPRQNETLPDSPESGDTGR